MQRRPGADSRWQTGDHQTGPGSSYLNAERCQTWRYWYNSVEYVHLINFHKLTVESLCFKGKYSCQITNDHGVQEDTSDLKVRAAPESKQILKDIEAKEGQTDVVFTAKADAYPAPKAKWYLTKY